MSQYEKIDALIVALLDAAKSLEAISTLSGRKTLGDSTFMESMAEVRGYALSRASAARAAIAALPPHDPGDAPFGRRHSVQELLKAYNELGGDWLRIARWVEDQFFLAGKQVAGVETKLYPDDCSATGIAPLPALSPSQQDAAFAEDKSPGSDWHIERMMDRHCRTTGNRLMYDSGYKEAVIQFSRKVWSDAQFCAYESAAAVNTGTEVPPVLALRNIIAAWESLPGGGHYTPRKIADWLMSPMKPAIDGGRAALAALEASAEESQP